jgi:hypothetical protein
MGYRLALLMAACASLFAQAPEQQHETTTIEQRFSRMESDFDELVNNLEDLSGVSSIRMDLESQMKEIREELALLSQAVDPVPSAARLSPNTLTGYQATRTRNGLVILISLRAVEPYLEGYKLKFDLGNTAR